MTKEKFQRTIKPETIKPEQSIYGIDEIGLILSYYGKESKIYKSMANGENVSCLIEESIKAHLETVKKEKRLLEMCKEREDLVEQSRQP